MKQYILISGREKDVEYQYSDFMYERGMRLNFLDFTRFRIYFIKLLKIMRLESAKIIRKLYFNRIYHNELTFCNDVTCADDLVVIILARLYEQYGESMLCYIREKFPKCKIVIYMTDLVCTMRFSLDKAKEDFDFLFSFDKEDAEKHNIYYLLGPFSARLLEKLPEVQEPEYDVTFVGAAKNRYNCLISLYETLIQKGLKCNFRITGVPETHRRYSEEIAYQRIDFEEVLMLVKQSRCVLEVLQEGGYSSTARYAEAMLLGKNLLTDCRALSEEENKEQNIFYFQNIEDIPFEKLRQEQAYDRNKYVEKFSIQSFIHTIDEVIGSCKM